jgi:hypothetical protein
MKITFDETAKEDGQIKHIVTEFLDQVETLERKMSTPVMIFQDGKNLAYYIKCSIKAQDASGIVDLDAKLDIESTEGYRANRELLLNHKTYKTMKSGAEAGREFNDIIVEYNLKYNKVRPLKVWGGQHRIRAISDAVKFSNRYHGFRIYFDLNKKQRTEVALISNTNINVSNDTFDRILEETLFGDYLRKWCQEAGFLKKDEDFPSVGSKAERITVKLARSFMVNFYIGKEKGAQLKSDEIDKNIYEPYLTETGVVIDKAYSSLMETMGSKILGDHSLLDAGKYFLALHNAQYKAVKEAKTIPNKKSYRNKAFVESILCGWAYIAGLLQAHKTRLEKHYKIPKTIGVIPDPLNAVEMSKFKHDNDPPTYRGLGTRSSLKDRQRVAQVFLAKSLQDSCSLDKKFLLKAVSTVEGLLALKKGYA